MDDVGPIHSRHRCARLLHVAVRPQQPPPRVGGSGSSFSTYGTSMLMPYLAKSIFVARPGQCRRWPPSLLAQHDNTDYDPIRVASDRSHARPAGSRAFPFATFRCGTDIALCHYWRNVPSRCSRSASLAAA